MFFKSKSETKDKALKAKRKYVDSLVEDYENRERYESDEFLSGAWSKRTWKKSSFMEDEIILHLLQITRTVKTTLVIHGIPDNVKITLSGYDSYGLGAAGFLGLTEAQPKNFTHPFIFVNRGIYDLCEANEVLDVYIGTGLHEASHINHTRLFYTLQLKGEMVDPIKCQIFNLLEDSRIEDKVCEESPGYAGYLVKTRKVLLEKDLVETLRKWPTMTDNDRMHSILFITIRLPHLLESRMKEWKTSSGLNFYEVITEIVGDRFNKEKEVYVATGKIYELLKQEKYDMGKGRPSELAREAEEAEEGHGTEGVSGGKRKRKSKRRTKDEMKMDLRYDLEETSKELDERDEDILEKISRRMEALSEKTVPSAKDKDDKFRKEIIDKMDEERKRLEEEEEEIFKSRKKRGKFTHHEIKRLLDRYDKIKKTLSAAEESKKEELDDLKLEMGEDWKFECIDRRNVIINPHDPDLDLYNDIMKDILPSVQRLKAVFQYIRTDEYIHFPEKRKGLLHRKMLYRGRYSDRMFKETELEQYPGFSVCLLLDESGSMGYVRSKGGKARKALECGLMLAHAFQGFEKVQLQVYSFTSCGSHNKDNLVKCLYSDSNPDLKNIACYDPGMENYDHMAIKVVGERFLNEAVHDTKLMFTISDGQPAGYGYYGSPTWEAVRKEVRALEHKGVEMTRIAIQNFKDEGMFTKVVKFLDTNKLVTDLSNLITSSIKTH